MQLFIVAVNVNIVWTSISTNAEKGVFFVLFLRFGYTARAVSVCYDLYTTIEYPHIGRYMTIGEVRDDQ